MKTLKYFAKLLRSVSFRKKPFSTVYRGLQLGLLIFFKRSKLISVPFGSDEFNFQYTHGERHGGGRGLFVFREDIEPLMAFGDRFLRVGDVVLDCGANQGVFSSAFSNYVGRSGKVVAFEPMPGTNDLLEKNLILNDMGNWHVVRKAVSDCEGVAMLDCSSGIGGASIVKDRKAGQRLAVETVTIDQVVKDLELAHVDFIKMDIEGAEFLALKGAQNVIQRYRPTICLEITAQSLRKDTCVHSFLSAEGYRPLVFKGMRLEELSKIDRNYDNVFFVHKNRL